MDISKLLVAFFEEVKVIDNKDGTYSIVSTKDTYFTGPIFNECVNQLIETFGKDLLIKSIIELKKYRSEEFNSEIPEWRTLNEFQELINNKINNIAETLVKEIK